MQVKMVNSVKFKVRSFFKIYDYSPRVNNYLCVNNTKWDLKKLPTYPFPTPTLTLTSRLEQNVGLGEG